MEGRLDVRKTYKLFIGGAFPRSESGRTYAVTDSKGRFLANVSQASRKDARDAVAAARAAQRGWWEATAYNRGQVLYRIAEMLEGRRGQFEEEVERSEGISRRRASAQVDAAIDRWVWYAGWSDKIAQVLGSTNSVAGPYTNFSLPQPVGVVASVAPQRPSLLGLVSVVAPIIVGGNTCILLTSAQCPLPGLSFAEVLATSDLPGGVINILTGAPGEIGPWLASHGDVDALDLTGVADDGVATEMAYDAADTVKRVLPPRPSPDWSADPGLGRIRAFVETTTIWHPQGV
jgi:acyl-CoA reductase-like NAD-dependent aldehyde dehydrogenase